jgi:hypothetical protein
MSKIGRKAAHETGRARVRPLGSPLAYGLPEPLRRLLVRVTPASVGFSPAFKMIQRLHHLHKIAIGRYQGAKYPKQKATQAHQHMMIALFMQSMFLSPTAVIRLLHRYCDGDRGAGILCRDGMHFLGSSLWLPTVGRHFPNAPRRHPVAEPRPPKVAVMCDVRTRSLTYLTNYFLDKETVRCDRALVRGIRAFSS